MGGRSFVYTDDGFWVDTGFRRPAETIALRFASEAYYKLVELYPQTAKYLALGDRVIFKAGEKFIKISETGLNEIKRDFVLY